MSIKSTIHEFCGMAQTFWRCSTTCAWKTHIRTQRRWRKERKLMRRILCLFSQVNRSVPQTPSNKSNGILRILHPIADSNQFTYNHSTSKSHNLLHIVRQIWRHHLLCTSRFLNFFSKYLEHAIETILTFMSRVSVTHIKRRLKKNRNRNEMLIRIAKAYQ